MVTYYRFIRKRLVNLGVPTTVAAGVAQRFQTQVNSRGREGAVTYLKRVGDALLWYLDPTLERPQWVKTRGRFPIFLDGMQDLNSDILLRIAKFARAIKLETPSKTQVQKVLNGVLQESSATAEGLVTLQELIALGSEYWSLPGHRPDDLCEPRPVTRQFRKVVSVSGKTPFTMEPPITDTLEILAKAKALRGVPRWSEVLPPAWPSDVEKKVLSNPHLDKGCPVGQIYATQEGGAKLRMFAAPFTVVQCILSPIHDWIDSFRRLVLTDCTYDQLAGAHFAQAKLQDGITIHSVDLTTATCRFPLGPQLNLLRSLGLHSGALEALTWACTGTWIVAKELRSAFKRRTLSWKVGQPLGIRPSMSMFSLTHNLLITGLCVRHGKNPVDIFRILGDDVVISDDNVARDYKLLMYEIGVPVSVQKSHSSSSFAEFAGASITKSHIVRGGQWKPLTYENVIGLAELYQRPLLGEGTSMLDTIQYVHLFGKGLYDPPVEDWPRFIRLYTLVAGQDKILSGIPPLVGRSWHEETRKRLRRDGGFSRFIPESSPLRTVFKVLNLKDEELRSDCFYIAATSVDPDVISLDAEVSYYCTTAWLHILTKYESGLVSKDEALTLLDRVESTATSLLYLPPKGRKNLHSLASRYRDAILAV